MKNKDIIAKADLALSDIASAGKLSTTQANRFIRKVIDQPTILNVCRVVPMPSPTHKINKIGIGSRMLKAATENTALSSGNRTAPSFEAVSLTSKELIAEVRIPYAVLEDNIEGGNAFAALQQGAGGLHNTLVDLMAERAALDLEELGILGDTGSGDAYLAVTNGWLALMSTNSVDAGGVAFDKSITKAGLKAMPTKYLRNRTLMRHFVSVNNETEMRDSYANRQTAMGDTQVQGNLPLFSFGSLVNGVALMPATKGIFTDPLNLIMGIQRDVTMEYDKDITTRQFIIVLTCRVDFQIEEETATVKYTNIAA
jgi:hypothetical protein